MKAARTVLRGPRRSNAPGLPDSAIRGFTLPAKVQGCWRTLQRHCRIRQVRRSLRPWQDHDCVRRLDERLYGWETSLSAMSR